MLGLYTLALLFRCTLDMVHAEWSSLPDCPANCRERESFMQAMAAMCKGSHLHPELVSDPRLFGNCWTI